MARTEWTEESAVPQIHWEVPLVEPDSIKSTIIRSRNGQEAEPFLPIFITKFLSVDSLGDRPLPDDFT